MALDAGDEITPVGQEQNDSRHPYEKAQGAGSPPLTNAHQSTSEEKKDDVLSCDDGTHAPVPDHGRRCHLAQADHDVGQLPAQHDPQIEREELMDADAQPSPHDEPHKRRIAEQGHQREEESEVHCSARSMCYWRSDAIPTCWPG